MLHLEWSPWDDLSSFYPLDVDWHLNHSVAVVAREVSPDEMSRHGPCLFLGCPIGLEEVVAYFIQVFR